MTVESREEAAVVSWPTGETITANTEFPINFSFGNNPDYIQAYIRDDNGNKTDLVLESDYTVSISNLPGNNNIWGILTILRDISNSSTITIYRTVDNSQNIKYTSQTVFAETTEIALDKLTMLIQDYNVSNRYIRAPQDENMFDNNFELPVKEVRYNKILGFNSEGNLEVADPGIIFHNIGLIVDDLNSSDPNKALSANQGRVLKEDIDTKISQVENTISTEVNELTSKIDKKADPLVAGDNIVIKDLKISAVIPSTPVATTTSVGLIQVGEGLSITAEGILSAKGGGGSQEQSDWNETDPQSPAFIKNKPWPAGYRYVYTLPTINVSNMNAEDNTMTTYNNKYYGLSFTRTDISGLLTISENPQDTAEIIKGFNVVPFFEKTMPALNNKGIFAVDGTQCIYYVGAVLYLDNNIYDKSVTPIDIKQNIEEAAGISISSVNSVGISNDILFIHYTSDGIDSRVLFCSKDFKNIKESPADGSFFIPHASVCGNSSTVCANGNNIIYIYDIASNVINLFSNNKDGLNLTSCYADERYFIYSGTSKTVYVKNLEGDFSSWITLDTNKYQQFIGYMHGAYFFKYNNVLRYTYSLESDAYYEIPYNTDIVAQQILTNNDSILLYNGASKCIIPELKPIL